MRGVKIHTMPWCLPNSCALLLGTGTSGDEARSKCLLCISFHILDFKDFVPSFRDRPVNID